MSRPKEKTTDPQLRETPGVRTKIYVRDDMVGGGKIDLLRLLNESGSITAAAARMGVGYRRAWFLLETLQNCFETPLFVTHRGGAKPGGTDVTDFGRELIARFDSHAAEVERISAPFIDWLEQHQRKG